MATTIGAIGTKAFDAVAAAITDAILAAEFFEEVIGGSYNATTGTYTETPTTRGTCRAVIDTQTPVADVYPAHVDAPGELLLFIEGITTFPKKGWTIQLNGGADKQIILPPVDILGAGSLAFILVR